MVPAGSETAALADALRAGDRAFAKAPLEEVVRAEPVRGHGGAS